MSISLQTATLLLPLALALGPASALAKVYQWTDAQGTVQFSDHPPEAPPPAGDHTTGQAQGRDRDPGLTVRVVAVDFRLTDRVQGLLESIPPAVERICRTRLGLAAPAPDALTVRLFPDRDAYERALGAQAAGTAPDAQYAASGSELLTWYRPSPDALGQVLAGARARALLQTGFPQAPVWLREGLARYFELLRVSGESAAVFPSPRLEAQVRALKDAGTLIPTARLVGLSDEDWRSENQADQRLDAQSWSLVYFLLSTPDGGVLLGEILAQAQASDGALSVSAAVLAARLPGGLGGLESGWRTWLGSRPSAHHY